MRKIVFGICALTLAAWLLNLGINPPAMNSRGLSHEVFYLNGVLAWGLMAIAIVMLKSFFFRKHARRINALRRRRIGNSRGPRPRPGWR